MCGDAGRPVADFLTAEDVRGRLLEHSQLSDITDFEERHADADAVLPLRVWRAVAHRSSQIAPVWVSADAFLQKLHATVDPGSSDVLGSCDCCLSRLSCADDVAAYHRGFALALLDDGQLTAPAWSAQRDDAVRRYLHALLPRGRPFQWSTQAAGTASASGAWKAPALACGRSWSRWRVSRWHRPAVPKARLISLRPTKRRSSTSAAPLAAVAERT